MKVRLGREVHVRRRTPVGAMFAVRMTREMLVALDEEATRRGVYISDVIREAIAAHLHPVQAFTDSTSTAQTMTLRYQEAIA